MSRLVVVTRGDSSACCLITDLKSPKELEVFPHTSDHNVRQGLRLPLQPGWAWLNPQTLEPIEERLYMSPSAALRQFLKDLDAGNSHHDFHQLRAHVERLQSEPKKVKKPTEPTAEPGRSNIVSIRNYVYSDSEAQTILSVFGSFPPNLNGDVWLRGRNYYATGLTRQAQRADAIFCMGHYLFYGDPELSVQPMGYGYVRKAHGFGVPRYAKIDTKPNLSATTCSKTIGLLPPCLLV